MTCINCPIEIADVRLYPDGVHVKVLYRAFPHSFYFVWKAPTRIGFLSMLHIISRVAQTLASGYPVLTSKKARV
jgi:hypothetical protein